MLDPSGQEGQRPVWKKRQSRPVVHRPAVEILGVVPDVPMPAAPAEVTAGPEVERYQDFPVPETAPPPPSVLPEEGMLTCIRLNCANHGLATNAFRCPRCDHRTQLLADFRWPRTAGGPW